MLGLPQAGALRFERRWRHSRSGAGNGPGLWLKGVGLGAERDSLLFEHFSHISAFLAKTTEKF